MPWCPKCKEEYREEFSTCSDCNIELVDELPTIIEEEPDSEAYLMTAADDNEMNVIAGLLESFEIPVRKKYREAGDFLEIYMGMTNYGIDLFVPSKLLEKAQEVLQSEPVEQNVELSEEEPYTGDLEKEYESTRRNRTWIVLLFFLIPALIGIIFLIISNLRLF